MVEKYLEFDNEIDQSKITIPSDTVDMISNGTLMIHEFFQNEVYMYDKDGLKLRYVFDFGDRSINSNALNDHEVSLEKFTQLMHIKECNGFLFYTLIRNDGIGIGFYDKSSKKNKIGFSGEKIPLENDIDGVQFTNLIGSNENSFFSFYEVYSLLDHELHNTELTNIVADADPSSNPVLVTYFMKNHY